MIEVALNIVSGASLGPEGPAVQISAKRLLPGAVVHRPRRTLQGLVPVGAPLPAGSRGAPRSLLRIVMVHDVAEALAKFEPKQAPPD